MGSDRIVRMFDPVIEVATSAVSTSAELADRIAATHATLRETECEELVLAAAWADLHYLDGSEEDYRPLVQRSCAWGGDGCPPVAEHCAQELGTLRGRHVRWRRPPTTCRGRRARRLIRR